MKLGNYSINQNHPNYMKNKYLIIAAHPDDDILGCGATLSKLSKNNIIKVIFIVREVVADMIKSLK